MKMPRLVSANFLVAVLVLALAGCAGKTTHDLLSSPAIAAPADAVAATSSSP